MAGTVGTAGTHGWDGKTVGPAVLSPARHRPGHAQCINDLFRNCAAPSHPAQKGPQGFLTQDNQGTVLRQTSQTESREGGRRDVIHDKANSFPLLSSPPTSPPENGGENKRLNRIKKTESTWERVFAAPVGVDCP